MTASTQRPALLALAFIIGIAVFTAMAFLAASNDTFPNDIWATRQIQSIDSSFFASGLDWTSEFARSPLVIIVAGLAALVFIVARQRDAAALLLGTQVARLAVPALKTTIERPRPSADLVSVSNQPTDFSFPSGHAFSAMLLFGLLFYLVSVRVRSAVPRIALQAACVWVIVVTGLERVYVGHHWPSDVLGGFLAGGLFLALFVWLHRAQVLGHVTGNWRPAHQRVHGASEPT